MDIKEIIAKNADIVEEALKGYLSLEDKQYGILYDAMRYSVLDGGKRIRPLLTLEFCRMYGGSDEAALPFACAIEMIHAYSLVHDDMPCMDNDDYRRGKLTCHKQYGEANALLCGDSLLTYAFEVASSNEQVSEKGRVMALKALAQYAGHAGMIGGQQLDLLGEEEKFDFDTLLRMNAMKTGCLIKCACLLGCIAAGHYDFSDAEKYAKNIGLTFQIIDDLLDEGTEDEKTTFLTFMSHDEAYNYAKELTEEAVASIDSDTLKAFAKYLLERRI